MQYCSMRRREKEFRSAANKNDSRYDNRLDRCICPCYTFNMKRKFYENAIFFGYSYYRMG